MRLTPVYSLLVILFFVELCLRLFNNFGLVLPYKDYFYNKKQRVSIFKGKPWSKFEFENILYRNESMQHVQEFPDYQASVQKRIFLLGDSIVESSSMSVDKSFYALADKASSNYSVTAHHSAGASFISLINFLPQYPEFFTQKQKLFKPDLAVIQIRPFSYQTGFKRSHAQKPIIRLKTKILRLFRLNLKSSKRFLDISFRKLVLGNCRVLSLLSWKMLMWSRNIIAHPPDHEEFFVYPHEHENQYWQAFEKNITNLKKISKELNLAVAVILVPQTSWLKEYLYTHQYNDLQKRYQALFSQYQIPFENSLEEFVEYFQITNKKTFRDDDHPNEHGSIALAKAFDKLIKKAGL